MAPRNVWTLVVLSLGLWPVGQVAADEAPLGGPPRELVGHKEQITALAYAPDSMALASADIDGDVRLWDPVGGKLHWVKRAHGRGAFALAFSPQGNVLASAGADGMIRLWDPALGREIRRLEGHQGPVAALTWSPDGKLLVSGGYDNSIRLWDATAWREVRQLRDGEGRVTALTFLPDGKTLLSGGMIVTAFGMHFCGEADFVRLWDVAAGQLLRKLTARGNTLALSPDAQTLVAGGHFVDVERSPEGTFLNGIDIIRFLDLRTGKDFRTITLRGDTVAMSLDGRSLASAYGLRTHVPGNLLGTGGPLAQKMDIRPCLWEVATGKEVLKYAVKRPVGVLTFSPKGQTLATGSSDGCVRLWDLRDGPPDMAPAPAEPTGDDMQRGWAQLGDFEPATAYRAVRMLARAPKEAVALLGDRLRPFPQAELKRVQDLIDDLGADTFSAREEATRDLRQRGVAIEPALRYGLAGTPVPEARKRLEALLDDLHRRVPSEHELRAIRAVQVLEMIGTSEARQVLRRLAQGAPLARRTQDAQAALQRLAKWPPVDHSRQQ